MKAILENPEEKSAYLSALRKMTLRSETVPILAEGSKTEDNHLRMHLSTLIWALPVELKLMHREIVEPAFSKEEWSFYTDLWNADEDTLTKMMEEILQDMEDEKYYMEDYLPELK